MSNNSFNDLPNGYLFLKSGTISSEWFYNVDWDRTKAYSFGLSGIYINKKGRESHGIVQEGDQYVDGYYGLETV